MDFTRPFTTFEAEVAVWKSWGDGYPILPDNENADQVPLAACKARVSLNRNPETRPDQGASEWRNSHRTLDETWNISLSGIFGHWAGTQVNFNALRDSFIVVIKWVDSDSGDTVILQFHYCNLTSFENSGDRGSMDESIQFRSSHLELFQGDYAKTIASNLEPTIRGRLEWQHEGEAITCYLYDPITRIWTEMPENNRTDTQRFIYLGPTESTSNQFHLSYLTYAGGDDVSQPYPPRTIPILTQVTPFTVREYPDPSPAFIPMNNYVIQKNGCSDLIQDPPNTDDITPATARFRFLRRSYMTIRNNVIALPSLQENTIPPRSSQPAFSLALGTDTNPTTQNIGLLLQATGGHLDGTIQSL